MRCATRWLSRHFTRSLAASAARSAAREGSRFLTLTLALVLALALPLQGLAAMTGLPACPHRMALLQPVATPPCHTDDLAVGATTGTPIAPSASLAADGADASGLPCAGCLACVGWAASAPAPAHPALGTLAGPGQAPLQRLGLLAQPGFAQGLERPPRAA